MRRALSVLLLLLLMATTAPSAATASRPWDGALARAERARDLASSGRIADAVRASASLVGVRIPPAVSRPASDLPPMPAPLRASVAGLLGAVRAGGELSRGALRVPAERVEAAAAELSRAFGLLPRASHDPRAAAILRGIERRSRGLVDSARIFSGALLIAEAIDRAIPPLQAYAATLPLRHERVAGCDVADLPPHLCIGGSGNNTYDRDYALLIDLSNADVHRHSAGAAQPTLDDSNGLAASVTIDFNGKDVYDSAVPAPSKVRAVQGAGTFGGIGMLVDTNGDDVYTARVEPPRGFGGQGYAQAGFGLLFDGNGDDVFSITSAGTGDRGVQGQSTAVLGGGTAVVDTNGDDSVRLVASPETVVERDDEGTEYVIPGSASAAGFGLGAIGGGAVFSHSGGDDLFELSAHSPAIDPAEERPVVAPTSGGSGFGVGVLGGAGFAGSGGGTTTWKGTASVRAPEVAGSSLEAFGVGAVGGFGALLDEEGNDSYVITSSARAEVVRRVDDACGCSGVRAIARIPYVDLGTAGALLHGFGEAVLGGIGILRDASGDDVYEARTDLLVSAEAIDDRTEHRPPGPEEEIEGAEAIADAGEVTADIESHGYAALEVLAVLTDEAGDDRYVIDARSEARATARSVAPGAPEFASAIGAPAWLRVLGAGINGGHAHVFDAAGADRYEARVSATAVSFPEGSATPGSVFSSVLGSAETGTATFSDVGGVDTVVLEPADPACQGTRGQGTWVDCGQGAGFGWNI